MEVVAFSSLGQMVAIATISETSLHMMELVKRIGSKDHPMVVKTLRRLDIDAQLESVESLVKQLKGSETDKDGSVIKVCTDNVHKSISEMHHILQTIEQLMGAHNGKWLSSFRGAEYIPYLTRLEEEKKVLDRRLDILIKVLMLPTKEIKKKSSWRQFFSRKKNKYNKDRYFEKSESLNAARSQQLN